MPSTPDIKDAIINQIVIGLGSAVIKLASKKLININTTLKYAFFILFLFQNTHVSFLSILAYFQLSMVQDMQEQIVF